MSAAAVLGRRGCAALAVASAGLHAILLGHADNPMMAALMTMMIVGCLYCARELWTTGALRAWCIVALMNLAMVALHTPGPGHHHGGAHVSTPQSAVLASATALALAEAAVATAVLYYRTRDRVVDRAF